MPTAPNAKKLGGRRGTRTPNGRDAATRFRGALLIQPDAFHDFRWWSRGESNPWPSACRADALPSELRPLHRGCGGPGRDRTGEPPECDSGALPAELQARRARAGACGEKNGAPHPSVNPAGRQGRIQTRDVGAGPRGDWWESNPRYGGHNPTPWPLGYSHQKTIHPGGVEPPSAGYQPTALPLSYRWMASPLGVEPRSPGLTARCSAS